MANEQNLKPFKKGESGNPNGRPPKLLSHVTAELKEAGFEAVTNAQVLEAYGMLINLDEARIKDIIANSAYPMFLRIVGKAMLGNKGTDMIEKMLERAYGKAAQPVHSTGTIGLVHKYVRQEGNDPLND